MISLTGSFVINTSAGTDEECTITIQDHPFKDNDVRFNNSTNSISFYENMVVLEKLEMPKAKEITKGT